jgi:hypothetical protein
MIFPRGGAEHGFAYVRMLTHGGSVCIWDGFWGAELRRIFSLRENFWRSLPAVAARNWRFVPRRF